MRVNVPGRAPTLGQVLSYYTRIDFLRFLLHSAQVRPVVLIVPTARHWTARWDHDILRLEDEDALRCHIVDRIRAGLPGVSDGDRPRFYPSFHQLIGKWPESSVPIRLGSKKPPSVRELDCVFEADLATWQESADIRVPASRIAGAGFAADG